MLRIRHARFTLLAILAAVALLIALPTSGIAMAHDQLVDSTPAEGQEFEVAPTEATLRFSAEMIEIGAEVALLDADTEELVELPEALEIDYDTLVQPLPELTGGTYALNWRVVSQDGHPISGTINFTVAGGAAPAEEEAVEEEAEGGNTGLGNAPADPNTEEDAVELQGEDTGAENPGMFSEPWLIVAFSAIAALVAAGTVVTFVMKMRRGNQPGK